MTGTARTAVRLAASWLFLGLLGCGAGGAGVGGDTPGGVEGGEQDVPPGCKPITERCDGLDNDCDGEVDEGFDTDLDGFTSCNGDCNDGNDSVYPGAVETKNGTDDNCDAKADNNVPGEDFDRDGTPYPADCNDEESLVGPLGIEVPGDGTDNDCNGQVDEAPTDCESAAATDRSSAAIAALGICKEWVLPNSASDGTMAPGGGAPFNETKTTLPDGGTFVPQKGSWLVASEQSVSVRTQFGSTWAPEQGSKMLLLSTGVARDNVGTSDTYRPETGKNLSLSVMHPLAMTLSCPGIGSTDDAYDPAELRLRMQVPQNARSFTFKLNFFSAEYYEYVGSSFNDRFVALLDSKSYRGNVSFDSKGSPISVNNALFDVCDGPGCGKPVSLLAGTGYELPDGTRKLGGATGWLTTSAPVTPGEIITLRLVVFDECDHIYDSSVLLDGFRWETTPVQAPTTTPVLQ